MKNSFNLEVCFSESPKYPYEWTNTSVLMHAMVIKVSSAFLKKTLLFKGKIISKDSTLLISDAKNAVALRLDKEGNIKARSFLKFEDELDVAELATNIKESHPDAEFSNEKIFYDRELSIESEMKQYLLDRVKKIRDEDFSKYLYYLYFDEVKDYSRDKLISSIQEGSIDKNMKVYKFLIES